MRAAPKVAQIQPAPPPPPVPQAVPDPVTAVVAEAEAALLAGLAAADEGHLDRARAEFDRAVSLLLSYPGGALADPRLAEAYRRTLETVQASEVEMIAAGDGFKEAGTEPASIDVVGTLPVGATPPSPQTRAQAVAAVASREHRPADRAQRAGALLHRPLPGPAARLVRGAPSSRGHKYLPHIRQVFKEEGIPQDLAYVALVESAFKPTAYSRAKARGVWQFIGATGRRYGLQQDWWVDERSDPEKATHAAARYLKELYELFGDWNLALAGYNAGEMKIVRGLRRYKVNDFWELRQTRAIRPETKNYVPLIHAAIVLAKSPERYGFQVTPDAPPDFERVAIEGAYDLRVIAECAGEPVEGHPFAEPRAATAGDAGGPHVRAARARPAAPSRSASA